MEGVWACERVLVRDEGNAVDVGGHHNSGGMQTLGIRDEDEDVIDAGGDGEE
jgi:hypothetical protein